MSELFATSKGPIDKSDKGKFKDADISLAPGYTVTNTKDGGGLVLTNVEVVAIFWGSYWSNTAPAPSPTPDQYYQAFTGIVTGPYMTRLKQYRGVGPGTMLGKFINDTPPDPANNYTDDDVVTMLKNYFQANANVPQPTAGHTRFYAVVSPPGINNSLGGDLGQHQNFSYNGVNVFWCWIDSIGGLTDSSSDGVINTFSHELVESCTDPLGNGILVDGTGVSNDEIGDTCNNEFGIVQMNGLQCNVQCYWSKADNACVLPLGELSFLVNKNTFGLDEVKDAISTSGGVFSNAFWLALDDFSINTFNSFGVSIPNPTGAFANLSGITISPTPANPGDPPPAQPIPVYESPGDPNVIQRIRFSFDVIFDNPLTTPFPGSGSQDYTLKATFQMNGVTTPGIRSQDTIDFTLGAGADPYFSNIDPTDNSAVSYLSQDLRVFPVVQGQSALPGDVNAPTFQASQSGYDYIQALLAYMNGADAYTIPVPATSSDPLNGLTQQSGYETGDSSVTPTDGHGHKNFNFAIARVRLRSDLQGPAGAANNTRVFFRLWIAPSFDTDFQPHTTYLSNPEYPALPNNPLASAANLPPDPTGQAIRTTPLFATDSAGSNDYNSGYSTSTANNNIHDVQVPMIGTRDSVWIYYGCFLDIYNSSNNSKYPGTHHCLVAQIAYDDAPISFSGTVATNPGNSDKLAQRNLQITLSGNPGPASTHRIPQAFDTRPSAPFQDAQGAIVSRPDEMMIDWGNTPPGSTAYIYWPQVAAADVVQLASALYYTQRLSATEPNTIQCTTVKGVTYIPIPSRAGQNFAGLLTVDLPIGVTAGQVFKITVRRISSKNVPRANAQRALEASAVGASSVVLSSYRYITGAFQIEIPVTTEREMLLPEENTLAVLKWRLENMSPAYRWYPVLKKYIDYVSGRVNGSGGNAGAIPPSLQGVPSKTAQHHHGDHHDRERLHEHTGKISGLIFDRFGDFEGFILDSDDCDIAECECKYFSRERDLERLAERAWRERLRVTIISERHRPHRPETIILREPPSCE